MGYDAFGLPAEQYAVQTGQHPRTTTEANIATMRRQLRRLGLAHDPRRSISTTDEGYYRWTQWIFLQIFNSWYDTDADRARPIDDLVAELEAGARQPGEGTNPYERPWADLSAPSGGVVVDDHRLAYVTEAPVNWCPGLGTVLANEEVTADGRSERGNFPVFKRPLKQWMMRITAYADRLIARPRRPRLARGHQAACSATGSGGPRARWCASRSQSPTGRRPADRGVHHPPRHAVRRHLHGAGPRAPAGRRS